MAKKKRSAFGSQYGNGLGKGKQHRGPGSGSKPEGKSKQDFHAPRPLLTGHRKYKKQEY